MENVAKTVVSVILKAAQLRIRTAALGLVASEGQVSEEHNGSPCVAVSYSSENNSVFLR